MLYEDFSHSVNDSCDKTAEKVFETSPCIQNPGFAESSKNCILHAVHLLKSVSDVHTIAVAGLYCCLPVRYGFGAFLFSAPDNLTLCACWGFLSVAPVVALPLLCGERIVLHLMLRRYAERVYASENLCFSDSPSNALINGLLGISTRVPIRIVGKQKLFFPDCLSSFT